MRIKINDAFRIRFKAFFIHSLFTIVVALVTGYLVFGLWYSGEIYKISGGVGLYKLLILCELILGPLLAFIIFNPLKPKFELIRDYVAIIFVQLFALTYGLYSVAMSRPAYLVFVKDRIEVVAPIELSLADLSDAGLTRFSRLFSAPQLLCVSRPKSQKESSDLILSALSGKDIQLMPRYFKPCDVNEVESRLLSSQDLPEFSEVTSFLPNIQPNEVHWLPVRSRFGSWIALYVNKDLRAPVYIEIDPFTGQKNPFLGL